MANVKRPTTGFEMGKLFRGTLLIDFLKLQDKPIEEWLSFWKTNQIKSLTLSMLSDYRAKQSKQDLKSINNEIYNELRFHHHIIDSIIQDYLVDDKLSEDSFTTLNAQVSRIHFSVDRHTAEEVLRVMKPVADYDFASRTQYNTSLYNRARLNDDKVYYMLGDSSDLFGILYKQLTTSVLMHQKFRKCLNCTTPFLAYRKWQSYCSTDCKTRHANRKAYKKSIKQ